MDGYDAMIMEYCGVDEATAEKINCLMRFDHPTLDALTKAEFNRLAGESYAALKVIEADPELAKLIDIV